MFLTKMTLYYFIYAAEKKNLDGSRLMSSSDEALPPPDFFDEADDEDSDAATTSEDELTAPLPTPSAALDERMDAALRRFAPLDAVWGAIAGQARAALASAKAVRGCEALHVCAGVTAEQRLDLHAGDKLRFIEVDLSWGVAVSAALECGFVPLSFIKVDEEPAAPVPAAPAAAATVVEVKIVEAKADATAKSAKKQAKKAPPPPVMESSSEEDIPLPQPAAAPAAATTATAASASASAPRAALSVALTTAAKRPSVAAPAASSALHAELAQARSLLIEMATAVTTLTLDKTARDAETVKLRQRCAAAEAAEKIAREARLRCEASAEAARIEQHETMKAVAQTLAFMQRQLAAARSGESGVLK